MTKTLTSEQIAALADKFEAAKTTPWTEVGKTIAPDLGYDDGQLVCKEVLLRGRRKAWEAFNCHPAVKAYALAHIADRGAGLPENVNYAPSLHKAAEAYTDNRYAPHTKKVPAFQPKGGCPLKLHAIGAVRFSYQQNSYSDDSEVLIPVIGEATDEQVKICQSNLSDLVRRMDTHNGMAGSGCNYSAGIVKTEAGFVAVIHCRSSIAD